MSAEQIFRFSAVARALVLAAITAPVLWTREQDALGTLAAIALIWLVAQLTSWRPRYQEVFSTPVEAALIGAACAFALPNSLAVLAALVVSPWVAGLRSGVRGVGTAISAQLSALVVVAVVFFGQIDAEASLGVFTWTVTGLGLGFVASFVRAMLQEEERDLAPYLYAQSLLRQLIDLSGGLSSGLEPLSLGGSIMSTVSDQLPAVTLAVYVPRGETLTALTSHTTEEAGDSSTCEDLAIEAWARSEPVVFGQAFAFPLGETAVVAGELSSRVEVPTAQIVADIDTLRERLHAASVHLDTALLFLDFRDSATADERRRLAREMHDGVAQDIASLGYIVDALAARPATEAQGKQLALLRERITHVVSEVRQSVLTLRTSVGESESLGAAVGTVARHLSEVSGVPIQVRLDEHATRLRPAGRGRALPDRPGGDEQLDQARGAELDRGVLPGPRPRRLGHRGRRRQGATEGPQRLPRPEDHARARQAHQRQTDHHRQPHGRAGRLGVRARHRRLPTRPTIPHRKREHMNAEPTTVLLIDDHELIRNGLGAVLDFEEDMTVVGTAASVTEALEKFEALQPAVVVTDLQLPDGTGLDVVRAIRKTSDTTGLIVLTMHSGDDQIFAAMQAGASGFVGKDAPSTEVIKAARHAAVSPRAFICAGLVGAMMRRQSGESTKLTDREHEVLLLLADGLGAAAIGQQLYLSESTAKSHIARIYQKLGAANRAQALVTAMRIGLLSAIQPVDR